MDFMKEALKLAKKSAAEGEVPIGAVLVLDGKIIARGRNKREKTQNALHHAEVIAIDKACRKLHSWRLDNAVMYVTLEPCPMCAGAIANARIKKVIYAARDASNNSQILEEIFSSTRLNHKVECEQGDYKEECSKMLTSFFKGKRKKSS